MTIEPREAAASLLEVAAVERRTREAICYAGASAIFIMWGVLVACGYGVTELYPRSARMIWLIVPTLGCAGTALIVALRMRSRPKVRGDGRLIWAIFALTAFAAVWSYLLGPIVPRQMLYVFQPSVFLLGLILMGLWLGRFFLVLGLIGIGLTVLGTFQPELWLRLWMAVVQCGTLIAGGIWLSRHGVPR